MPDYGYKLVFPDQEALKEAGFGKVAHVPAIFDSEPGYARLPSQFLIDRALGVWEPKWRGTRPNPHAPSRISIKNFGYWLCNALEWAEVRGIDLVSCDYTTHLIARYQNEMLQGIWSQTGESLAPKTVNSRVDAALEFQMWCADKGHRKPFVVPTVTRTYHSGSANNSKSHEAKSVEARKGKVKVNKHLLVFPADKDIELWRKNIYAKAIVGQTHGLMVDHILNTGIRREELACWRVDTLPLEPKQWQIVNPQQPEAVQQVAVELDRGAKGTQYGIDQYGDKIGPRGTIQLPLWLSKRIHAYRNQERLIALKHVTRGVKDLNKVRLLREQCVHLYLHPATGKRYTGDQIYQMWTKVEGPKHWSPHLGRDWWACQYLWQKMQEHKELLAQLSGISSPGSNDAILAALKDTVMTVIQTEIQPQLRHASSQTTEIYLQWLFNQLRVPLNLTRAWHEMEEE